MAAESTMRQLNLLLVLLNAQRPLSRVDIFERVNGYGDPEDPSAQRKFERDKAELRSFIVFEESPGEGDLADTYRIDKSRSFIRDLDLTSDERLLIALAVRAWRDVELGQSAAAGATLASYQFLQTPQILAAIGRDERHLATLERAIAAAKTVQFEYFSRNSGETKLRTVQPWKLVLHQTHWYLHGFEESRAKGLLFRLSRISGDILITVQANTEIAPPDLDSLAQLVEFQRTEDSVQTAKLQVPKGNCANLRLRSKAVIESDDFDILEIDYDDAYSLATEVAVVCDRAVVLSPLDLRNRVSEILKSVIAVHK